jgi:choline dehydrogenase-like flavoprotein
MIINLSQFEDIDYDLCVVGSGPIGMIVALEYARLNPSSQVILIEYGEEKEKEKNQLDDSIRITNPINHHQPYDCTNKGLGGTSMTWGGRCVMYDEIDFIDRPILKGGCTWDVQVLRDCEPFINRATNYFECGTDPFNLRGTQPWGGQRIAEGFAEGDVLDSVVERWSMPTRFGSRYRNEIATSKNLHVILGMEARNLGVPSVDGTIQTLELRAIDNNQQILVRAKKFVLAAGTQETTRILLRNSQVFNNIGGPPDSLGRYYQGHLSGKIASVQFAGDPKKTEYGLLKDAENIFMRRRFQFSKEVLGRENLLNTAIWLDNPLYHEPNHANGALSMFYLAMISPIIGKRLAPRAIANSITKGKFYKIHRHFWNVIKDLPGSLMIPAMIFYRRYCVQRKLPQIFLFNPQNYYALHFHAEQIPSPSNRMCLDKDGETLEIRYELTDDDISSVIRLHEILDQWLRKCGCGHLVYWFPRENLSKEIRQMSKDGVHQSGTTRIADSPDQGVVDRDLRVWGTKNLYVCSSSVLPTSGQANPTFFTGVLAVKLAEHLGCRLTNS